MLFHWIHWKTLKDFETLHTASYCLEIGQADLLQSNEKRIVMFINFIEILFCLLPVTPDFKE